MDEDGGPVPPDSPSRVARVGWMFAFLAAAYNLVRMRTLAGTLPVQTATV